MELSIVVPVYNEEGSVAALHKELVATLKHITDSYEIIFVDDGSQDNTLKELQKLKPITIIALGRNTGQSAALKAGFDHAQADIIISLDGDGQNPPKEIPKLLKKLNEGYDVVSGWRKHRKDPLFKKLVSRVGVKLHHFAINDGVQDSGCTLKAYRARYVKDLELWGELHRYLPALLKLRGARIAEVVVEHRQRRAGKTKYSMLKVFKGLVDLGLVWFWQKYSSRPVHLFGALSLLLISAGGAMGLWAAYLKWGPRGVSLSDTFLPHLSAFSILIGVHLFATGILADILIRNYYRGRPPYHVREIITQ